MTSFIDNLPIVKVLRNTAIIYILLALCVVVPTHVGQIMQVLDVSPNVVQDLLTSVFLMLFGVLGAAINGFIVLGVAEIIKLMKEKQ